jgi:hypothetical protein
MNKIFISVVISLAFLSPTCSVHYTKEYYADYNKVLSYKDCLNIITHFQAANYLDSRTNIKVCVTPYIPQVIVALQRNAQRMSRWSEVKFKHETDILLKESCGLFLDWDTGKLYDSRGNFFKDYDSLLLLLSMQNLSWTSINSCMRVMVNGIPVMLPIIGFDQVYLPDISDIQNRLLLINGLGDTIRPVSIYGRKNSVLSTEETMFLKFKFYNNFLSNRDFKFVIKGFESDILLNLKLYND